MRPETRGTWWESEPEALDTSQTRNPGPKISDSKSETRDLRPSLYKRPETQDTEVANWNTRCETLLILAI